MSVHMSLPHQEHTLLGLRRLTSMKTEQFWDEGYSDRTIMRTNVRIILGRANSPSVVSF